MKKLLLTCCALMFAAGAWSQCVFSCYTYSQSPITPSLFPTGGTDVISQFLPTIDDGITSPIPLGFNFNYFCNTYTAVLICSNGFIQMDIGSPPNLAFSNPAQSFPSSTSPNGMVALNMNDFDPNMGGTITYTTLGTAPNRMFVVTYSNVPIWSYNTSINSGQIILYETTDVIEIHSQSINASNTNAYNGTQGIEDATGMFGSAVSSRNNALWQVTSPDAYRWTPIATYTPAPLSATITGPATLCAGTPTVFNVTTTTSPTSFNWSTPGWNSTSSSTAALSSTVASSGNLSVSATYTCGTTNAITFSVTALPLPVISVASSTPQTLCSGESVTITTAGAVSYTMEPGGIPGTPPFIETPSQSTTYSFTGTDANGCVSSNTATAFVLVYVTPTLAVNSGSMCEGNSFTINATGAYSISLSTPFAVVSPTAGIYNYTVNGSSIEQCTATPVISTLTVHALPTLTASATRSVMCNKFETNTVSVGGATSYTWSSGQNTTSFTIAPITNTNYIITGVDANGCKNTTTLQVKVNTCTGLDENNTSAGITVFPNPSSGNFMLKTDSRFEGRQIDVYDMQGRLISSVIISEGNAEIKLGHVLPGAYFLKVKDAPGVVQRVIVQ